MIRRLLVGATAVAALVATAVPAGAITGVTARRLAGTNRYDTARAIATATFSSATVAAMASGENFPDALAASYLEGRIHGPVLLTPQASLAPESAAALQTMSSSGVELVGGTAAISDAVATDLKNRGYTVDRAGGTDRYDTARKIAELFPPSAVGTYTGAAGPTAIIASGENFPDALAAGPISYARSFPLLLTNQASLNAAASEALTHLGVKQVIIAGGPSAVSTAVETSITAMGIAVNRIGGVDRQDTAGKLADFEVNTLGWAATHVNLARGDLYPDALAGAAHGGLEMAPILLTADPNTLSPETTAWLQAHHTTISSIDVFGGPAAISDTTVAAAQTAAT